MTRKGALPLTILTIAAMVLPLPALPATITVDGQTGDPPGTCDLVEAIENAENDDGANADCATGSGDDQIVLTVDVVLNESVDGGAFAGNGLPPITGANGAITIEGGDFTIERDPGATDRFRLFLIEAAGDLTLNQVTLTGGRVSDPFAESLGGAIFNSGSLTLTSSTVSGNTASAVDPYPFAYGGGLYNLGATTIIDSSVSGNRAEVVGQSSGYLNIAAGGGISNCLLLASCPDIPLLTIESSTISGNTAEVATVSGSVEPLGYSGALHAIYGDVSVTNSTVSGNSAEAMGGISSVALGGAFKLSEVTLTLTHTTIASNSVDANGGYANGAAMDYFGLSGGSISIYGSVIGNHLGAASCSGIEPGADGGSNLADDDSCGSIPDTLTGLDPVLMDNGGPTRTHALLAGSTAIDAAGSCGLPVDQRGVVRPDGFCDSGAYERAPCQAPDGDAFDIPDGTMVSDELTVETCTLITLADVDVFASGHLILRTAGRVEIGNGFEVDGLAARLTVDIDSGIVRPSGGQP